MVERSSGARRNLGFTMYSPFFILYTVVCVSGISYVGTADLPNAHSYEIRYSYGSLEELTSCNADFITNSSSDLLQGYFYDKKDRALLSSQR